MTFANLDQNINASESAFKRLGVDDQLGLLWFIYVRMGQSITPAAPDAASPDIAQGLFDQVKALDSQDQLEAMRDIAREKNTVISREYGSLSANTKLAFWYKLAKGMDDGTIIPVPQSFTLSDEAQKLLAAVEGMDFEQQITLLRDAVMPMGAEPTPGMTV